MPYPNQTAIITHASSDMSFPYAEAHGILQLPDYVIFGEQQYRTLLDISSEEFFRRLETEPELPTSSPPSAGAFAEAFTQAAAQGASGIICLVITGAMSGCFNYAESARRMLEADGVPSPLRVYDSAPSSHGLDFMAAFAARRANGGMAMDDIIAALDALRPAVANYFIFDSLKYLRRSGRVGAIRALAADTLGLRPILTFQDGVVRDIGMSRRGYRDGIETILTRYRAEAGGGDEVIVFHSRMEEEARGIIAQIREATPDIPVRTGGVGPVMGLYSSPKCIGVVFRKKPC